VRTSERGISLRSLFTKRLSVRRRVPRAQRGIPRADEGADDEAEQQERAEGGEDAVEVGLAPV
jgi:hypothetical protein